MTLANAMVLVDQTAVPLTLAEIMRTYDVGRGAARTGARTRPPNSFDSAIFSLVCA